MMRLLLIIGCFFLINMSVFANQASSEKHRPFAPVDWHLTTATGGFSIKNETSKIEFVQIAVNNGAVGVFKKSMNNQVSCMVSLGENSSQKSTVCELAPNETLFIDKDFSHAADATGVYQIEVGNF